MEMFLVQGIGTKTGAILRLAVLVGALSLSGCALFAPEPEIVAPVPEIVIEPPQPVVEVAPEPEPPPRIVEPPPLPEVAIVLASRQPAYEDVAVELGDRLENLTIYDLSDRSQPPATAFRLINDSNSGAVVAIGLQAAKASIAMAQMPVVFSQVFNYREHGLVTENSRGIAALAPLDAHLSAWKKVDPTLARVGMIIGEGHEDLVAEAEVAAARHGLELHVRETHSDQETLYQFKRMIREIDGFWLFPDNRILSPRILRDMLEQANRRQVPVAVSHEAMLSMGAAISVSTVASDIATTIISVLERINAGEIDKVPPLTGLSEVRVVTNDAMLKGNVSAEAISPSADGGSP